MQRQRNKENSMNTTKKHLLTAGLVLMAAMPSPAFAMSWHSIFNFFKRPAAPQVVEASPASDDPSPVPSNTNTPVAAILQPLSNPIASSNTVSLNNPIAPASTVTPYKTLPGYGSGPNIPDGSAPFTFKSLMDLIQSNQVNSVDQLLPLLPQSYRSSFALMFQSGSLQTATATSPRVIAYGNTLPVESIFHGKNTDRLYLAFQTDTGIATKLPNSLEVIEWIPEKKAYQFYQLDFPLASTKVEVNPAKCSECHGTPLRPNWTAYPRWDGALGNHNALSGNFNDNSYLTQDQVNAAVEPLKKNNDRLKSFDLSAFEILNKIELPNANMSGKIGAQLQVRNVEVIRNSPDYNQFKYAFAGAFMGCVNYSDFFDARTQDALQAGVYAHLANVPKTLDSTQEDLNFAKLWQMTGALVQNSGTHFGGYSKEVAITTWMRFLLEGRGNDGALLLKDILGTPPFASPAVSAWSYDFVGFGDRITGLGEQFLENASGDFPEFDGLFMTHIQEENWDLKQYSNSEAMRTENGPAAPVCQQLASKSRAAMTGYTVPTSPTTPDESAKLIPVAEADASPVLSKFKQYCTTCHGTNGDIVLPLGDLDKLKAYRTSAGRSIEQRLLGKEMPPPTYAVQPSDDERKAMIDGLSN
jgi:cytochrome c5